jgi:hypothetical protein
MMYETALRETSECERVVLSLRIINIIGPYQLREIYIFKKIVRRPGHRVIRQKIKSCFSKNVCLF